MFIWKAKTNSGELHASYYNILNNLDADRKMIDLQMGIQSVMHGFVTPGTINVSLIKGLSNKCF